MSKRIYRHLLVLLALIAGLGGSAVIVTGLASGSSIEAMQVPQRDLEPVIIAGKAFTAFLGLPADQLFVYAYDASTWRQIPAQVDEVSVAGRYTTENGLLDDNDEIVFMAVDLGDRASVGMPITGSLPISSAWYEIEVTDPVSSAQQGWAYLVRSAVLTPSEAVDYVEYDPGFHRISTTDYAVGFGAASFGADYLALGGSGIDILDRHKVRVHCAIPGICPLTESWLPPRPDDVIKDGPVRVIARGGEVLAYGSMLQWSAPIDIPWTLSGTVRFSVDLNEFATGALYYSAAVTEGVTVDGITDTVPATPRSPWWQLSTVSGTVIHLADTSSIGGIQSNYYVDNAEWDPSDTGDHQHYGDTGVLIENAERSFNYTVTLGFLAGSHPNVGATYEALWTHPLSVTTVLQGDLYPDRCRWPAPDYADFYMPPDLGELISGRLGELLRIEHISSYTPAEVAEAADLPSSLYGAEAYRVLYLSQTPFGTPQAVSGLIIVPTGIVPEGGFPVLAHGHGTLGLADTCAPSKYAQNVPPLLPWAANGYIVSATDYAGLGTPGLHPYAVGESEAYSMLDGARAALDFCDSAHGILQPPAANDIFLEGHSQGGHAALFAHQAWGDYAPELDLLGTVTFAPGAEPRLLTQRVAEGSSKLTTPAAMIIYSYGEYYPEPLDLQAFLKEPYATEIGAYVEEQCLAGLAVWIGFDAERVFQPEMVAATHEGRWDDLEPLTTYLDANTPGDFGSDVPVLVIQGENDPYILPEISLALTRRLCQHGISVALSRYASVGHSSISRVGRPEALQWMTDRLAGMPATDSCADVRFRTYVPSVLCQSGQTSGP